MLTVAGSGSKNLFSPFGESGMMVSKSVAPDVTEITIPYVRYGMWATECRVGMLHLEWLLFRQCYLLLEFLCRVSNFKGHPKGTET